MTTIAWTGKTWNPIKAVDAETGRRGWFCEKVSPGCTNCYAEAMNGYRGNRLKYRVGNREKVEYELHDRTLIQPLRWTRANNVFPCSMTDLFFDGHPDWFLDRIHVVMAFARRQTFQVLTKRPNRARAYYAEMMSGSEWSRDRWDAARAWLRDALPTKAGRLRDLRREYIGVTMAHIWKAKVPIPNLHLGVSAEDRKRAEERIPTLLRIPGIGIRWVSQEPALEHIDFTDISDPTNHDYHVNALTGEERYPGGVRRGILGRLNWIVVGGESGRRAREFNMQWALDTVEQCRAAGVAPFVKQMGTRLAKQLGYRDVKGEDPSEWIPELRVREYPAAVRS